MKSHTKTLQTPVQDLIAGTMFAGRYKIIAEIGRGGMGVVYKAEDTKLKRTVALKFLPPELTHIPEVKERFVREAQAAAALDHPNICTVYEFDEAEETTFISMAYIEGQSLKKKSDSGPLELDEALKIAMQVAEGLQEAHKKGVVHRDIKSANIMVDERGQANIMDFGLARMTGTTMLTQEGTTMGTIAYMSPEQSKGEPVDQRTDIWSLGVVIYEMITGEQPFKGHYEQAIVYSILNEDPRPIDSNRDDIPPELTPVITKALSKDPDNRYQTIRELLSDLRTFISKEQIPRSYEGSKISKKLFQRWQIAALSALILLIISILYFVQPFRSDSQILKSLVVLPFDNYTGSEELEYFVAGMHSSLIEDISKISALRVISKTTSNAYKDVKKSISEIASELSVDAVVEASVLSLGDSVRIQVKLVSAFPQEQQLWVQDYYEDKSQILNLYNKITKEISKEINVLLTPQEESLLAKSRTVDKEVYDSYLKGHQYLDDTSLESLNKAKEYFNIAIEKDPDWAPLYSGLAVVWVSIVQMGFESADIAGPKIFENLNKALELDPNNANSHFVSGMIAFLTEWDWEKAEMELLKALAANPSDAMSRVIYAQLLGCLQRPGESLTQGRLGIELDPLNPLVEVFYAAALSGIGDFKTALAYGEKVTAVDPGNFLANNLIEVAAFRCRDYNKVMEAAKYVFAAKEVDFKEVERIFGETGFVAAYEEILRQLEVLAQKGYFSPVEMAYRYMMVDQPDKAMEWIEKGFEVRDPAMPYIATHLFLCEPLFDNPRFIEIVQKMNLPFD